MKNILKRMIFALGVSFFYAFSLSAQINITGTVVDATGETMPGVNVTLKGTVTGTVTDMNGKYTISVPDENSVLVFSFIGYAQQEVTVGNQTGITVTLTESTTEIDEVVVVGYGTVLNKSSLTGSITALSSKKLLTATTPRVENMLNGKAPGVFVATGSGQPGATASIVIRGKSTVNGSTDPLWVVDGVIVGSSAGDLNPADIETLTVLKDAASTAIYGSQGSNGVIVVTTRKGRSGKATVSFSAKLGTNTLDPGNLKVMNGSELYDLYNSFANPEAFSSATWWNEDLKKRDFNWWDNATKTGFTQDYNISMSGGNEKLSVYASLGYYDETGAVKGYDYSKYTARLNANYKMFDWLTIKPNLSLSRRDIFSQQHSVSSMYSELPWDNPFKKDGSLVDKGTNGEPAWVNAAGTNYMYDLQWNYSQSQNYEFMGNFDFSVKLTDWLNFESVNSYRFGSYTYMSYTDPRSSGGESSGGTIRNDFTGYDRIYTNQLLRFNKTFNEVHRVHGILAYEWNEYNGQNTRGDGNSIPPGAQIASLAAVPSLVTGGRSDWATQSYFTELHYDYADRYLLQGSIRRDGASNFGVDNRYGTFFAVSGAWNIHEEAFFAGLRSVVNSAKVRLSYGSTGNRPSSLYPSYTIYSLDKAYSYNGISGALISAVGNSRMTWETSYTTDFGLDVSLFNSRLNLSLDLYNKNTSGLLYQTPLPSVWGVTSVWRNVGEVNNKGFEITVGADVIRTEDLRWNVELNLGANRNEVTALYGERQEIIVGDGSNIAGSASKMLKPGYDSDTWYLTEWAGVNPENGKPQWYTTDESGTRIITEDYADASKNPVTISAYTPKFSGGFSTTVNYKFIDLNALFTYSVGGDIYNYSRAEYDSDGAYTDRNQMKLMDGWSRWTKAGDVATHPQALYGNTTNSNKASSRYLEDGSYLKLKALTLGCNLPVSIENISAIRIYVSGENLFTVTKYSGVDPEIPPSDASGSMRITGVSTAVYPAVKKLMFGLNVTF